MSGYIHSGVKGKMDRIFKPSPGKILVSDKLGNAVESNKTVTNLLSELEEDSKIGNLSNLTTTDKTNLVSAINEINANSSGGAEWEWNPIPIYDEILTNGYYYDIEDDIPYELPSNIFGNGLENLLIFIEKNIATYGTAELGGSCVWNTSVTGLSGIITKYRQNTTNNDYRFSACFSITKEHGQYVGKAFSRLRQSASVYAAIPDPSPIHTVYTDLTVSSAKITYFSLSESLPSNTRVTVYTAL